MFRSLRTRLGILGELFSFLWQRKLWWLLPMIVMLLIFGVLLVLAQGSAIAPFIYTLF
jgi:NAD/NADP transhydrogenase beta subunit